MVSYINTIVERIYSNAGIIFIRTNTFVLMAFLWSIVLEELNNVSIMEVLEEEESVPTVQKKNEIKDPELKPMLTNAP